MSFIVIAKQDIPELRSVVERAGWRDTVIDECGSFAIAANATGTLGCTRAVNSDFSRVAVLIGEVLNANELRSILSIYDSAALTANDAGLILIALATLGAASLTLFDGAFSGAIIEPMAGHISLFTDCNGQLSAYATREPQPWFASELKLLCLRDDFRPEFLPVDEVANFDRRAADFCPVTNVRKVRPGEFLSVSWDGIGEPMLASSIYHAFRPSADRFISRESAETMIGLLLGDAVANCLAGARRVGVPLSGGLDSSLITALASRQGTDLLTFAIGTEVSAEFEFAELVSRHVGTRHEAFVISEEDILEGMMQAIRYNEIFDGLSAEVQSPLFALYNRTRGAVDTLITGYGADLLFGGVVMPQQPCRSVNEELWRQVYRTHWTGEFSPMGGSQLGIRVRHPFWNNRLLGFCLDLAPELKVSPAEIKICLRELAAKNDLLPLSIAWRKKVAIHEGSSVNTIFSKIMDAHTYSAKTQFTYFAYKYMLENCHDPSAGDVRTIFAQFRRGG